MTSSVTIVARKPRSSAWKARSSSESSTREKSIESPSALTAFPGRDDLGDALGGRGGVTGRQGPAPRAQKVSRRRRLRGDAEAALHVYGHGGRPGRLLGHEHERRGRQLLALTGFVVAEPRGPA